MRPKLLDVRRAGWVRRVVQAGCVVLLLGATFTWNGSSDDDWDNTLNWTAVCANCYPDDCLDDATFPAQTGGWGTVTIVSEEQIDNLIVLSSVDFVGTTTPATLEADKIEISGTIEGGTTTVTLDTGTIKTTACP